MQAFLLEAIMEAAIMVASNPDKMPRVRKLEDEPKKATKKWTNDEELQILMYMRDTKVKGREIEKPTVKIYYERMLLTLKLERLTVSQISYKVDKFKKSYNAAFKWASMTGAGVDSGSVKEHQLDMCEHFDLLQEIYADKLNTKPPNRYESASSSSPGIDTFHHANETDLDDNCDLDENCDLDDNCEFVDIGFMNDFEGTSTSDDFNGSNPIQEADISVDSVINSNMTGSTGAAGRHNRSRSPIRDSVNQMRIAFRNIPVKSVQTKRKSSTAADIMCDWQNRRSKVIAEKTKLLLEKGERENKWKQEECKLAEAKFAFDKQVRLMELDLKKAEMEKEERLAKLKMELDFKLALELGKKQL